ncbi:MAG: NAD(P)-binding domain-containing protein [Bacteroidota bacterium]
MKIALLGYGKMGKTIEILAVKAGHTVVHTQSSSESTGNLALADVAIEFSTPETAIDNIMLCLEMNIPVVSGTTGWLDHYADVLKKREDCNGSFRSVCSKR